MTAIASTRLLHRIEGTVQGVGFRPFVYRLAHELELTGAVRNTASGAEIEVEGDVARLAVFAQRLLREKPPACEMTHIDTQELSPRGEFGFTIAPSLAAASGESRDALVLPDLATCPDCLAEIRAANERRYRYAFTNCTNCGPRFTILEGIPYDRPQTTMRGFSLCPVCAAEYTNALDRRFHAQPIACPSCGPRLSLDITAAAEAIRSGQILALKGIGGYQLLADARNPDAIERLRRRKNREEKPFAVLFPNLIAIESACHVDSRERGLLQSPAAPIVLLRPRRHHAIAPAVALDSSFLGAMLPYSPLHHLLMAELGFPVVATSGNRSDEPIATGVGEAHERLAGIADLFLDHDRPIARPCDDSVARILDGRVTLIRRARGYAPLPVRVNTELRPVLALGAHQKNTVAIARGRNVFLSQHLGDLDTEESCRAFERAILNLERLFEFTPELIACDLHPDYYSTQHALTFDLPIRYIQHHEAHVAACVAEHHVEPPYLGVAWDGTGYGRDGVIWGSEFFHVTPDHAFERLAHLRPFRLPGGESAVRDCRRTALSLLHGAQLDPAASGIEAREARLIRSLLDQGIHAPLTTSMGRLFDAVAVLAGVASRNHFEGQAPMRLEAAIREPADDRYPVALDSLLDPSPLIAAILADTRRHTAPGIISRRFHNTLVAWIVAVAERAACHDVVLTGGVFQNAYLSTRARAELSRLGFRVHLPSQVPANDGGIALGQAVIAGRLTS